MQVPVSRPRVFMNDLELAMDFSSDGSGEPLVTGPPTPGFQRSQPPEMQSGKPFDPFKADIWQLFRSYVGFEVSRLKSVRSVISDVFPLRKDDNHRGGQDP